MKKSMKLFALILAVAMMLSLALPASATDATLPEGMEWMTPFDETVKLNVVVGWDADSGVKEGTIRVSSASTTASAATRKTFFVMSTSIY